MAAFGAMRRSDGGKKKAKVIVDFGDGPDRRARAPAGGFLLNRNRWTQPVNGIYIRAFHLIEELPRVGGKGFHVAALAFGIDGVKGQRRLARPAQAGNHGQRITWNVNVNVLEIVLARPAHRNLRDRHRSRTLPFRNVDGSAEMLESEGAQLYSRILLANSRQRQRG